VGWVNRNRLPGSVHKAIFHQLIDGSPYDAPIDVEVFGQDAFGWKPFADLIVTGVDTVAQHFNNGVIGTYCGGGQFL
jgi:hypothetical protein